VKYADLNKNEFIVLQFMKNVRIAPRPIFLGSQASEPPLEEIGRCGLVFLARSMVTEFVGPSLFYAGSTMSRDLIIDVEIQSLSSLEILHRTGIVHGDLSEFSLRYTSDEHKIYLADLKFASFFPEVKETGETTRVLRVLTAKLSDTPKRHAYLGSIWELYGETYTRRDDFYRCGETFARVLLNTEYMNWYLSFTEHKLSKMTQFKEEQIFSWSQRINMQVCGLIAHPCNEGICNGR